MPDPPADPDTEPGAGLPEPAAEAPDTLSGVASLGGVGGKLNKCGLEWEGAVGACTPMPGGLGWCGDGLLGNGGHQDGPPCAG